MYQIHNKRVTVRCHIQFHGAISKDKPVNLLVPLLPRVSGIWASFKLEQANDTASPLLPTYKLVESDVEIIT